MCAIKKKQNLRQGAFIITCMMFGGVLFIFIRFNMYTLYYKLAFCSPLPTFEIVSILSYYFIFGLIFIPFFIYTYTLIFKKHYEQVRKYRVKTSITMTENPKLLFSLIFRSSLIGISILLLFKELPLHFISSHFQRVHNIKCTPKNINCLVGPFYLLGWGVYFFIVCITGRFFPFYRYWGSGDSS